VQGKKFLISPIREKKILWGDASRIQSQGRHGEREAYGRGEIEVSET